MSNILIKNIDKLVTCDAENTVYSDVDLLIENGVVTQINSGISNHSGIDEIDASGCFVYPGLINTHHHFFQSFVRNRVELDWSKLSLMQWLDAIYPIFAKMTENDIYHSAVVSIAELIKHGCTTAFDHQYNYTKNAGTYLIDRQFEAANLFGIRFHAGRGTNTLPLSEGSTIPDTMCETTDAFLVDCERLLQRYHNTQEGSMAQVVIAPCQPVNCYPATFVESVQLADTYGAMLHTHLGEGENATLKERTGLNSIEWCIKHGFYGKKTWYAHGWEFDESQIRWLAQTGTGISHCPAPVFLVGAEITNVPYMLKQDVRIGLGVDGPASNDNSNLLECIRLAYLLQCLNASNLPYGVPEPKDYLHMATRGGASILGRNDIGSLEVGKMGDCFGIKTDKIEYVATLQDPISLLAKVGIFEPTHFTAVGGRVVWKEGEFPGLDENELFHNAQLASCELLK